MKKDVESIPNRVSIWDSSWRTQRAQSSNVIESESGSPIFDAPRSQQRVIHDAPANVNEIFETAERDASRLEAPASGTELLHHIAVASVHKREQTVAAKQWP